MQRKHVDHSIATKMQSVVDSEDEPIILKDATSQNEVLKRLRQSKSFATVGESEMQTQDTSHRKMFMDL